MVALRGCQGAHSAVATQIQCMLAFVCIIMLAAGEAVSDAKMNQVYYQAD